MDFQIFEIENFLVWIIIFLRLSPQYHFCSKGAEILKRFRNAICCFFTSFLTCTDPTGRATVSQLSWVRMILGGGVSNERGGFGIINLVWVADHERETTIRISNELDLILDYTQVWQESQVPGETQKFNSDISVHVLKLRLCFEKPSGESLKLCPLGGASF